MYFKGLTADGRGLTNFMRTESLNHEVRSFYEGASIFSSIMLSLC